MKLNQHPKHRMKMTSATNFIGDLFRFRAPLALKPVGVRIALTTALTPALSPEERENRSPRFGDTDTLGYRAISSANDRDAATAMDTKELSSDVGNCPLSVRERVRVRAGVQTNFR